jgi:hypothetical protein
MRQPEFSRGSQSFFVGRYIPHTPLLRCNVAVLDQEFPPTTPLPLSSTLRSSLALGQAVRIEGYTLWFGKLEAQSAFATPLCLLLSRQ